MTVRKKPSRGTRTPRSDSSAAAPTQAFFGFSQRPFALSPDPAFLYRSHTHGPALDTLLHAVQQLDGLLVLTGDIGTGKTTLCRAILGQLDQRTFSAMVLDPLATREDLLKTLLIEFGVVPLRDVKSGRLQMTSRSELHLLLREFLESFTKSGSAAMVVIDEAHNLTPELWEEIRILSDLHTPDSPIHVLLVGLPTLLVRLQESAMRGIDQRISVRCRLEPLSSDDVAGFVKHRLDVARPQRTCEFTEDALTLVSRESRGVPRLISLLCDRALHEAYARSSNVIDNEIVEAASSRLEASLSTVHTSRGDNFAGPLGDWLTHLEHAVDQTPKAPLEVGPARTTRTWSPRTSLLKKLFRSGT